MGSLASPGVGLLASREDHVHVGVHSIAELGEPQLIGNITLSEGTGISLSQVGNDIAIAVNFSDLDPRYANIADPETITGLWTFDRNPAAPFAVSADSAVVSNLDADKLDGVEAVSFALADKSRPSPWVEETDVPVLTDEKYPNALLINADRGMQGDLWAETDDTYNLGVVGNRFHDARIGGTYYGNSLSVDNVSSHLIPDADNLRDLGTETIRWRNAYFLQAEFAYVLSDYINERTVGEGVYVDQVLCKDGTIPDSAYPNALLLDGIRQMTGNVVCVDQGGVEYPYGTKGVTLACTSTNTLSVKNRGQTGYGYLYAMGYALVPGQYFSGNLRAFTSSHLLIQTQNQSTLYMRLESHDGTAYKTGIELINNKVKMPNLPTSDPATAGELWNDTGTVKISSG